MEINEIKTLLLKTLTFSPNQGIEGIDDAAKAISLQLQEAPVASLCETKKTGTKFHFITDDEREAYRFIKSGAMACCLWDIRERIRTARKYELGEVPADQLLETTLDDIAEIITSAVNLEEINL